MPIYEYQCQTCGAQFEKFFRSMARVTDNITCPECHGPDVERLMSAPVVHAGGSGSAGSDLADSTPASPSVFGRKELKQAEEQKRQIKEQVAYEKKQAKK